MGERTFLRKKAVITAGSERALQELLYALESAVWYDLRLHFNLEDNASNFLLAAVFYMRPYVVTSPIYGDSSTYLRKHGVNSIQGEVRASWSIRETVSVQQSTSSSTYMLATKWCTSLMKKYFPDGGYCWHKPSEPTNINMNSEPVKVAPHAQLDVSHKMISDEILAGNKHAQEKKIESKLKEADLVALKAQEVLWKLKQHHDRTGVGDLETARLAVSKRPKPKT